MRFEDRIDHVGVIVNDLSVKSFFSMFNLEVQGEWESEGEWMDQVFGLNDVKAACVGLPDGQAWIELIKFYTPSDEKDIQQPFAKPAWNGRVRIAGHFCGRKKGLIRNCRNYY
ncbi:hypothetical protein [Paenibacillus spongiae]|uniref:VOC family protein n=1 Tax=Paenibacillus spongiae TaxID=2909671 RepID=A0ABY5SHK7_9BACL|nr:hypothetical protein [Paenibacillus spongiae]UVI33497.1 hypothetical protein L1F29_17380 [Paenibacillus spongiae]